MKLFALMLALLVSLSAVAAPKYYGDFNGNAAGLTNIPAAQLAGTINDARLSANIPNLTNVWTQASNLWTFYYSGELALSTGGRVLYNGASLSVLDWSAGQLQDGAGSVLDWDGGSIVADRTIIANSGIYGDGSGLTNTAGATALYQFVTLEQLQNAVAGTETYYLRGASNAASIGLSGTVLSTNWAYSALGTAYTNTISGYVVGDYVIAFLTADVFKQASSGLVDVDLWLYENGPGDATVTTELYAWNTATGNEEYEFTPVPSGQVVPSGAAPQKRSFSITIPDYSSTTNLRAMVKVKVTDTLLSPPISIVSGGSYNTHVSFSQPGSAYVKKSGDVMTGLLVASTAAHTNANNTGSIPCGYTSITNLAGNIVIGGFTGVSYDSWFTLLCLNTSGGDLTVTFPAGCRPAQGASTINAGGLAFYCTNGGVTQISGKINDWTTNVGGSFFKAP